MVVPGIKRNECNGKLLITPGNECVSLPTSNYQPTQQEAIDICRSKERTTMRASLTSHRPSRLEFKRSVLPFYLKNLSYPLPGVTAHTALESLSNCLIRIYQRPWCLARWKWRRREAYTTIADDDDFKTTKDREKNWVRNRPTNSYYVLALNFDRKAGLEASARHLRLWQCGVVHIHHACITDPYADQTAVLEVVSRFTLPGDKYVAVPACILTWGSIKYVPRFSFARTPIPTWALESNGHLE